MLKSYLKIAIRNILRGKGHAFLNIAGLAVGLAVCLLIMIYVNHETSFDAFHADKDRIVRIEPRFLSPDGSERGGFASLAPGYIPFLEREFPAVEKIGRLVALSSFGDTFVTLGETTFKEKRAFLADASLLEILTLPLLEGDPKTVLAEPNSMIVSASTAKRYFGGRPALGRTLKLEHRILGPILVRVTGVMKDTPLASHVHFDLLGSLTSVKADPRYRDYFYGTGNLSDNVAYVYARLAPGSKPASLEAAMPAFLDRVMPDRRDDQGRTSRASSRLRLIVRPVTDIHLKAKSVNELEPGGDPRFITFFILIAAFILIVACVNFINLATARASRRAREVGLRKVVGGHRRMLAFQFLLESLLIVAASHLAALAIVFAALPGFSAIVGQRLSLAFVLQPQAWLAMALVFLFATLASGLYPAAYISGFKPAVILRGELTRGAKGARFRKALVVFQFVVSIVLIVSVGVVGRQMRFLRDADLGFDRENVLLLPASREIIPRWDEIRRALTSDPRVLEASLSKRAPSGSLEDAPGFAVEIEGQVVRGDFSMPHNRVSREFFRTYGIKLVAGRDFSADVPTDASEAFILNEAAVRRLGWKSPAEAIGRPFRVFSPNRIGRVIGVAADFNYESLHKAIQPIVTYVAPEQANTLSLRIAPGRLRDALEPIRSVWSRFWPGIPFEFDFLDDRLRALYGNEERMMRMFGAFSVVAVFIACLGLFGLASYAAERRTREVGIRKILGASATRIVTMFSREFVSAVLAANLFAWPIAFILMKRWLGGFAYKAPLGWTPFLVAAAFALVITLLTVASQSYRAATANPAVSMRHE